MTMGLNEAVIMEQIFSNLLCRLIEIYTHHITITSHEANRHEKPRVALFPLLVGQGFYFSLTVECY